MKKAFWLLVVALLTFGALVACTGETYEIALVTDIGNIDDKSFNEGAWNGVVEYATANDISYAYYRPQEDSTQGRVETIENAISKGAKVVVCPGYMFEVAIYEVQGTYPDVNFLLLDGEPQTGDYTTYETKANTHNILYKEEQAGYLAGYAAVMDGFTELGFVGGQAVPAVVRYGYGFVQGAEAAALELDITDVYIKYTYADVFWPTPDLELKMDGWYADTVHETEVVFACGGGLYLSVVAAAENTTNGKVIGVDVDQVAESEDGRIISSAMKGLTSSVVQALTALYDNDGVWPATLGGQTSVLGAAEGGIGLPTVATSWKFTTFTVTEYNAIFAELVGGTVVVSNSTAAVPTVTKVTVNYEA